MSDYMNDTYFLAKADGDGDVIITGDASANVAGFHEIILPEGFTCHNAIIQVISPNPTSFDFDVDCTNFLFSPAGFPDGPGLLFGSAGKILGRSVFRNQSVGFVKAPAGYNIAILAFK